MRILFILEYFHPHIGGVEKLFKQLTESLTTQGHHVTIITNRFDQSLPRKESGHNLNIYRYSFRNRYLFTFLAWLPAVFKAGSVDIIHTTSYNAAFPAWVAARIRKKKVIITFHEVWGRLWFELPWMNSFSRYLHYAFEKFITRLNFDRFVAVSDFTKNELAKCGIEPDRLVRIYNGIDYIPRKAWTPHERKEAYTFTFFGRIGYSKGIDLLLLAAKILKDKKLFFKINLIISRKPSFLLRKIRDLIETYDLTDDLIIRFDIKEIELTKTILASDAVVIPSYSEGFCFAAAESVALGVPIISSHRGALKEVVSGPYLAMTDFTPEDLARTLEKAIMGQWSRKPVMQFPLDKTVEEYTKLYRRLI